MNDYALELAGIEKVYKRGTPGEVAVLRGATLEVKRGEVVALVAPSGAGYGAGGGVGDARLCCAVD